MRHTSAWRTLASVAEPFQVRGAGAGGLEVGIGVESGPGRAVGERALWRGRLGGGGGRGGAAEGGEGGPRAGGAGGGGGPVPGPGPPPRRPAARGPGRGRG